MIPMLNDEQVSIIVMHVLEYDLPCDSTVSNKTPSSLGRLAQSSTSSLSVIVFEYYVYRIRQVADGPLINSMNLS